MLRIPALVLLFTLLSVSIISAQSPKREFRAAWIATVGNIDWPSKQGLPSIQQQQEFIERMDQLQAMKCNAVIVQVRPACDAFYPSATEPWSRYLTGRQGQPPFPYYDPLKFMIEEAHKRNMEFHAWFNPFRALVDSHNNPNPANHVTRKHPNWIVNYGGKSYINPGIPEAREYVINVITEVVKNYDIDAVHLDDYFYPYKVPGVNFGDQAAYNSYRDNFTNINDWRRNNVNVFISLLSTNIKHINQQVKLGISPFGIWRNQKQDPEGSATSGSSCYDDLYADVLLWAQKGWVDYLLPQLYWEHKHRLAAFDILLPWWEAHSYGRHIYYGLGVYRMTDRPSSIWSSPNEILWEINDIRNSTHTSGFSFYSMSSFDKIRPQLKDSLNNSYNKCFALMPTMRWIDSIAPTPPVVKAIPSSQGTLLQWHKLNDDTKRFVVYRFVNNELINLNQASKIIAITNTENYLDKDANKYKKCTYIVTALDRLWNESISSNITSTQLD